MLIKARMGISADGYVGTTEGIPVFAVTPGFAPGVSHGYPEFIKGCDAVVMGRRSFLPALGAPRWPWPGLQVHVLTSSPLPPQTPDDVVAGLDGPAALAEQLRSRPSGGDVHLVGGVRTIRAFHEAGALDRLELVVLPILLGQGESLSPPGAPVMPLRLLGHDRTFPDGSVELVYAPAG
jgi:dihydrofolate reductase